MTETPTDFLTNKNVISSQQLRIASLNAWGIPFSKHKSARMQALSKHIGKADYDVIALQEIWQPEDLKTLSDGAIQAGLTHQQHYPSGVLGSGLVIFSKYPIIKIDFRRFSLAASSDYLHQGDYLGGKGIGFARLQLADSIMVDVYTTHLVAQYRPDDLDEHKAHRATQIYELSRFVTGHTGQQYPAIVCGDFNTRPHQVGYAVMTQLLGMTDSFDALHPDAPGITYSPENPYNHGKVAERIDYVFSRDGQSQIWQIDQSDIAFQHMPNANPDMAYSDHYGLDVHLTLKPAPPDHQPQVIDDAARHPVLKELHAQLSAGWALTEDRKATHRQRIWRALGVTLALMTVGRAWWKVIVLPLIMGYVVVRWLMAYLLIPDEKSGFKMALYEVEQDLAALEESPHGHSQ